MSIIKFSVVIPEGGKLLKYTYSLVSYHDFMIFISMAQPLI